MVINSKATFTFSGTYYSTSLKISGRLSKGGYGQHTSHRDQYSLKYGKLKQGTPRYSDKLTTKVTSKYRADSSAYGGRPVSRLDILPQDCNREETYGNTDSKTITRDNIIKDSTLPNERYQPKVGEYLYGKGLKYNIY